MDPWRGAVTLIIGIVMVAVGGRVVGMDVRTQELWKPFVDYCCLNPFHQRELVGYVVVC